MKSNKILVVDDDKELLYGMSIWLRSKGYQVSFAQDGPSAIRTAQAEKPDLILLDIGLPGGDGYQTMARLKSLLPLAPIPILIISASEASIHQEKALKAGAEAFFQKPIDHPQLLSAIQKALEGKTKEDGRVDSETKKILIIDDDQDLLRALRVRLQAEGYEIHFGMDAVLSVGLALKIKPNLILLDIGLPGGGGYLTLSRLRSSVQLVHIPVIIITAADSAEHEKKALLAGAAGFFQKPLDHVKLLETLRTTLGESPNGCKRLFDLSANTLHQSGRQCS